MIYRTDPFGRFTFVNPVATRILGFDEGELLAMKYFELMRPDWVPRAMGFYEKSAKTRESTYLEFPVRKKDGRRDLGRPARAADHHRRPDRRLPGHGARHHRSRQRPVGAARRARLRVGDSRHGAEPDHGARRAGTHRALQPRVRGTVRRVDVGTSPGRPFWEVPFLLDEDRAEIRDGIPRLAASTEPVKLDRIWIGKNGARHVIAWTVMALRGQNGSDVVPDRPRRRRDDDARARALEVAVHFDGQPRAAHAADLDSRLDAAADRRRHDRQRGRRPAGARRACPTPIA